MKFKNIKQAKRKKAPPVKKPQKKKIGESGENRQFPSIYRFITELKPGLSSVKYTFRLLNQSNRAILASKNVSLASINRPDRVLCEEAFEFFSYRFVYEPE